MSCLTSKMTKMTLRMTGERSLIVFLNSLRDLKFLAVNQNVSTFSLKLKILSPSITAYDQNIFRTMIFKRVTTEFIVIDGNQYEVSNSVNLDHWDCKEKFLGLITKIEEGIEDEPFTPDNLASWKKDFVNKLKDFEKKYIRHAKQTNPTLAKI